MNPQTGNELIENLLKPRYKVIAVIYKITSIASANLYVGSTMNFNKRKSGHLSELKAGKHHSQPLQRAYNKYGLGNLIFKVIEEFEYVDTEHRLEREQYYINLLKPEYNVCMVAGSPLGLKRSKEFKAGAAKRATGKKAWNKGLTKETSEIIKCHAERHSLIMKGKNTGERPESVKQSMRGIRKGKPFSEEHKAALRIAQQKRHPSTRNISGLNIKK